jgi:predicted acyl esterase
MGLRRAARTLAIPFALIAALAIAPAARAEVDSVFDGAVACSEQDGIRFCGGDPSTVPTWDGVPIDVNVALPPQPASGPDGPYPFLMMFHGWGGTKLGVNAMRPWAARGYAVFSMTDRGFGESCGATAANRLEPICVSEGYIRLMDDRYEVRDAQHFAGRLVDEGIADPSAIGATGGSYGGGISMALAALRDRTMLPDGSLVPWTSPDGTPLQLAAATPEIPWTDLAYSLMPNGHTLDYVADAPYLKRGRIGVMKQSYVAGLFASGAITGTYAPPLADPDADLNTWFALINAGEPYEANPATEDIVDEITTHHSSYYIDHSTPPAPLLISNGWTDDLFPVDEAIRFYNRTRTEHPDADISLFFLDYGHARGQNKDADTALLADRQRAWFDYYLKGQGTAPEQDVEVLTTTCGGPSAGPYEAPSWARLAPGEVRFRSPARRTVQPLALDPAGTSFDPIAGGGACATASGADTQGAATYRMNPAPVGGYTLMGSPTIVADLASPGATSQLAARLLDVAPNGDATLVARGIYRPEVGETASRQVFQLHPNAWRFAAGHVLKLELLPADAPYARPSNGQQSIAVSNLELRLPVLEHPGTSSVQAPAPKVVPDGYELAADYRAPRKRGRTR